MKQFLAKIKQFFLTIGHAIRDNFVLVLDFTDRVRRRDVTAGAKACAILGYFFFFIPIIMQDDNQFSRFHANQGLLNLILSAIGGTVLGLIPGVGFFLLLATELFCSFNLVRGIILSARGKAKGIPLFGQITIIAYRLPGQ